MNEKSLKVEDFIEVDNSENKGNFYETRNELENTKKIIKRIFKSSF